MIKPATCLLLFVSVAVICAAQHDTIRPKVLMFDTAVYAKPTDTISPFFQKASESIKKTIHYLSFARYYDRQVDRPLPGPEAYEPIRGKKINTITIKVLYPFGVNIDSPDKFHPDKFQRFANRIQNRTRNWVIKNELLFKEGDAVDPLTFSDTERNLWQKNIYKDIRFVVSPVDEDGVDVVIYIRDRWNWSLQSSIDFTSLSTGPQFSNILGFPQQVSVIGSFNYRLDNPYTILATYVYSNIAATHIDAAVSGRFDNLQRGAQVSFNRPFFSGKTEWAGRAVINYYDEGYTVPSYGGPAILEPNKVNTQDFWLAKTFSLPGDFAQKYPLYKLIGGVRMARTAYLQRPFIYNSDGSISFLNQTYMVWGLGFAQWSYYIDHNVYTLVQTEYFPKGLSGALLCGFQEDEVLGRRGYLGLSAQYGYYFKNVGYFLSQFKYGGFAVRNNYTQQLTDWRNTFYTVNEKLGRVSIRHIVNVYVKWGYDHPFGRDITVDNFSGLRGLYTNQLRGNATYALDYELDLYAAKKILGFKTCMFLFTDFALIQGTIKDNTFQPGVGLGFRFRNVNLSIDFIQLMVAYYPGLNIPYQNVYNLLGSNRNDRQLQDRSLYQPTILNVN